MNHSLGRSYERFLNDNKFYCNGFVKVCRLITFSCKLICNFGVEASTTMDNENVSTMKNVEDSSSNEQTTEPLDDAVDSEGYEDK